MKNSLLIVFLVILTALNVLLLVLLKTKKGVINAMQVKATQNQATDGRMDMLLRFKEMEMQSEDLTLPDITVWKTSGEQLSLSKLVAQGKKMIFYFTESHCDACIQHAIAQLKKVGANTKGNEMVILSSYANTRHFQAFVSSEKLPIPVYNIKGQKLNIPAENIDRPVFFILDKDLRCRQVFISMKEIPDYTENYVRRMLQKHWNVKAEMHKEIR